MDVARPIVLMTMGEVEEVEEDEEEEGVAEILVMMKVRDM